MIKYSDTRNIIALRESISSEDLHEIERLVLSAHTFSEHELSVAVEVAEDYCAKGEKSGYNYIWSTVHSIPVGFCCFGPIPCTVDRYEIYWIVVDGGIQRTGIGTLLLREAEKNIRRMGGKVIYLDTSSTSSYLNTRKFYEKNGYSQVTVLEDFYSDGDHKVIYSKKICLVDH